MDPAFSLAVRGALAVLFLAAAVHKARDFAGFRAVLADYRLVPGWAVGCAAALVVALECGVAIALPLTPQGPWPAAGLLGLYTGAIAINLVRGRRDIDCGCAGRTARQALSGWLIVRNVVLGAAALATLAPSPPRPLVWLDACTIGGAITALAAAYATLEQVLAAAPRLALLRGST